MPDTSEFSQFSRLVDGLLKVPHKEIAKKMKEYKKQRKHRKRAKLSSASRASGGKD